LAAILDLWYTSMSYDISSTTQKFKQTIYEIKVNLRLNLTFARNKKLETVEIIVIIYVEINQNQSINQGAK